MSENRRKKEYGQKAKQGAAILAVTILCCGVLRLAGNAIHQMWQEVSVKTVVYAADGVQTQDYLSEKGIEAEEAEAEKTAKSEAGHISLEKNSVEEENISSGDTAQKEENETQTVQKEKTMYLTFDDGPTAENTLSVLDTLKERNIKATFFVVGENVEKHPEVAKRIVEEGHTIGIHCYSHDYEKIYASVDSYLADFEKAYNLVYEVTGVKAELFRFPGGSINAYNKKVYKDIIAVMTERGYLYYDWNASLEDAVKKSTPESLLANARETTLDRKKVIMLCHDTVYNTTLCLGELIDQFPEYQMEPLTPEVTPIQF